MAEITLHYFDLYARGEAIRQIFVYHGTQFTDHRIQFPDWPAIKQSGLAEFGQLPVVEIDGLKLVQSRSIIRYLSQKFGYYPDNIQDVYWVESLCDYKEDMVSEAGKVFFSKDPEAIAKLYSEKFPVWLAHLEARLVRNNGGDGWFVGNSVTRADFEIFQIIWDTTQRAEVKDTAGPLIDATPKLAAFLQRFLDSSPALKAYLESRPSCTF
jgi:glutathione S-transferase